MKNTPVKVIVILFLVLDSLTCFTQTQWTKYIDNPVFEPGPGTYDIIAVGQPTVLFENDTIKMWYAGVGDDLKARICYAYSLDGIQWTKNPAPVIDVGQEGDWDDGWLDTPEIVKDESGYKIYYFGDTAQQKPEISSAIGVAYSTDGINWIRDEHNPIFSKGDPGGWDESWVESPAVMNNHVSGEYSMWYNGASTATWKIQIGLATSADGISWTRHNENPVLSTGNTGMYDDMWLGTPTLISQDELYQLWYSSASSNSYNESTSGFDTIHICYATSTDGIYWKKHVSNPLFNTYSPPYDSLIDSGGPWAPEVIFNENTGEYMMWYESLAGFSLATAPIDQSSLSGHTDDDVMIWISPNPMTDHTVLQSNIPFNNATFTIHNTEGKTVMQKSGLTGNEIRIERSNLPDGVYIIQVIRESEISVCKIVLN